MANFCGVGMKNGIIFYLSAMASFVMPFFNIPLIWKIRRLKSAKEISLIWTCGVWVCVLLVLPQAWVSPDLSFKIFGVVNFILFSFVAFYVWRYRHS